MSNKMSNFDQLLAIMKETNRKMKEANKKIEEQVEKIKKLNEKIRIFNYRKSDKEEKILN